MGVQQQLEELEHVAEQLHVKVCYEPMAGLVQGTGGLCKVKGEYRIIVDKRLRPSERLSILVDALRRFDLAGITVADAVRRLLEPRPPTRATA